MNVRWKVFLVLIFLAASLYAVKVASAQQGSTQPTDDQVNAVAKKLYCPVCPNTPLDVCETQACKDWRAQIKDQLSRGWSEQQIINYFVAQYGERVLGEPQRKGFTSMVWVFPVIGVVLGIVVVWQVLRSWRKGRVLSLEAAPALPQVSAEVLAKVEQELQKID